MKQFLVLFILCLSAFASDTYFASALAGSNNGTSCANAYAYTDGTNGLGVAGTWAAGAVLHLCGTFSFSPGTSTVITAQASGSNGSPITLKFETGAVITATYWTVPVINLNDKSYITVDGGTNGTIQATANGTSLANQQDGGICINNGAPNGISATNNIIQNVTCQNLYVINSPADNGGESTYGFDMRNVSNLTVQNNTFHDLKWATRFGFGNSGTYTNPTFTGNTAYNVDHCFFENDTGTGVNVTVTNTLVYNNTCHDFANWDNTLNNNHHDGFHLSANTGSSYSGVYIYNNYIYGDLGTTNTAGIFSFPDANTYTNYYVFNNLFISGANNHCWNNGDVSLFMVSSGPEYIYNNTFVSISGACLDNAIDYGSSASGLIAENNIFKNFGNNTFLVANGTTVTTIDYNDYYLASNFTWKTNPGTSTFATWQTECSCDSHTITSDPMLTGAYLLQAGSPADNGGLNLYSTCNGQPNPGLGAMCLDKAGVARPTVAAWSQGAYQYVTTPAPPPAPSPKAFAFNEGISIF